MEAFKLAGREYMKLSNQVTGGALDAACCQRPDVMMSHAHNGDFAMAFCHSTPPIAVWWPDALKFQCNNLKKIIERTAADRLQHIQT